MDRFGFGAERAGRVTGKEGARQAPPRQMDILRFWSVRVLERDHPLPPSPFPYRSDRRACHASLSKPGAAQGEIEPPTPGDKTRAAGDHSVDPMERQPGLAGEHADIAR